MKTIILSILFCIFFAHIQAHPIHVSVVNIEYDAEKKCFDLVFKFFIDDFQYIINKNNSILLNLGLENELENSEFYISKYIFSNFQLSLNKKRLKDRSYKYKGKKIVEMNVWVYYQIDEKVNVKSFVLKNKLMTDLYYDQSNLMIFTYGDYQTSFKFDNKNIENRFSVKQ